MIAVKQGRTLEVNGGYGGDVSGDFEPANVRHCTALHFSALGSTEVMSERRKKREENMRSRTHDDAACSRDEETGNSSVGPASCSCAMSGEDTSHVGAR